MCLGSNLFQFHCIGPSWNETRNQKNFSHPKLNWKKIMLITQSWLVFSWLLNRCSGERCFPCCMLSCAGQEIKNAIWCMNMSNELLSDLIPTKHIWRFLPGQKLTTLNGADGERGSGMPGCRHVQQRLWWDQVLHSTSDLICMGAMQACGTKPYPDHPMGSGLVPAGIVVSRLGHFRREVWLLRAGPGKDRAFQAPFWAIWEQHTQTGCSEGSDHILHHRHMW